MRLVIGGGTVVAAAVLTIAAAGAGAPQADQATLRIISPTRDAVVSGATRLCATSKRWVLPSSSICPSSEARLGLASSWRRIRCGFSSH